MAAKPLHPGDCISCGKHVSWLDDNPRSTNLDHAIDLTGTAAYGSGWDGTSRLIVYVCDECLRKHGSVGNIHQVGRDGNLHVWSPANPDEHADFVL